MNADCEMSQRCCMLSLEGNYSRHMEVLDTGHPLNGTGIEPRNLVFSIGYSNGSGHYEEAVGAIEWAKRPRFV